jgi:hypothetical protein
VVQVTNEIANGAKESPDGKHLYFSSRRSLEARVYVLRQMALGGGELKRITDLGWLNAFDVAAKGVYFGTKDSIEYLDLLTRKTTKLTAYAGELTWFFSVSPDERYLLYTLTERKGSDLMLVENFR